MVVAKKKKTNQSIFHGLLKNFVVFIMYLSIFGCMWEFGEYEEGVRVAQAIAESNYTCSFSSALLHVSASI